MSNFFDDMWEGTKDIAGDVFSNVSKSVLDEYLGSGGFVQTGKPPQSNPTANQVAQGERGSYQTTVAPKSNGLAAFTNSKFAPFAIVGGALVLGLLLRRGK